MKSKIKASYSWSELADGTRTKPGNMFLAMIEDYVLWSRIETGIPHRFASTLGDHNTQRPRFLTDEQARVIGDGLAQMRFAEPFAYRIFWKYYFTGTPLSQMRKNCNFNYELRMMYSWDGSDEALAYALRKGRAYLHDYISLIAGLENKRNKNGKITRS